jgi:hypothetical protein
MRKPGKAPQGKVKVTQCAKKMATMSWGCRGILLIAFKETNTTVNALCYASILHVTRHSSREEEY